MHAFLGGLNMQITSGIRNHPFPVFFQHLADRSCLTAGDIQCTSDGFYAVARSIADILIGLGITTFPNAQDQEREFGRFFDDWFLYAVPGDSGHIYSLVKMREQEFDANSSIPADGDTPGVTISFIAFNTAAMASCLADPQPTNRKALAAELDRVVAARKQTHHPALKHYFNSAEAEGTYLIADMYVQRIAALASDGCIAVPVHYAKLRQRSSSPNARRAQTRVPDFITANNDAAGCIVCDHEKIYIRNTACLTVYEKRAILATHTANVSFHSFAAEVRYHARFLIWFARIPIPFLGRSVYSSAIRADMSINDTEFQGPAPYYRLDSRWVQQQMKYHTNPNF